MTGATKQATVPLKLLQLVRVPNFFSSFIVREHSIQPTCHLKYATYDNLWDKKLCVDSWIALTRMKSFTHRLDIEGHGFIAK